MPPATARTASGAQTLARGLLALRAVAAAPSGLTVQEIADRLVVHRTIAYRMVSTLAEAGLVAKGDDGRYRGAAGLLELRAAGYEEIKHVALPLLVELADSLGATASLLVPENDEAVALLVVSPRGTRYHIAFSTGSRHPLDRGAAGRALTAALPPRARRGRRRRGGPRARLRDHPRRSRSGCLGSRGPAAAAGAESRRVHQCHHVPRRPGAGFHRSGAALRPNDRAPPRGGLSDRASCICAHMFCICARTPCRG